MKTFLRFTPAGLAVLAGFALVGCSTAKVRVMPGEGGVNRAVARDIKQDGAEGAAVDAANDYCKDHGKSAVFIHDKSQYTGKMDEQTRNMVRHASTAAAIFGAGTGLGTAGTVGNMMTSDRDYESEVTFKCQ